MKRKKVNFSTTQREWLARTAMLLLFVVLPLVVDAQAENATLKTFGEKLKNLVVTVGLTATGVIVVVRLIMIGVSYASKDSEERGEEDAKKLKSGLMRLAIGAGIALGATGLATVIVSALT